MTFCDASNKRFLDFDLEKLVNAIIQFFLPLYKGLSLGFQMTHLDLRKQWLKLLIF
jgi:hypothetical protein